MFQKFIQKEKHPFMNITLDTEHLLDGLTRLMHTTLIENFADTVLKYK